MSRCLIDSINALGNPVQELVRAELLRGAPIENVIGLLAGMTGAIAAGAITINPDRADAIHALIDQAIADGLCAPHLAAKPRRAS